MNSLATFCCLVCFAACAVFRSSRAQNSRPAPPQTQPQPKQRNFDAGRAIHDVKIGEFYMHRGDFAGAIARSKEALLYNPHYADACLRLGRAYEKSNDPRRAISYYQKYLQIRPNAHESEKVRKRIVTLQKRVGKENSSASHPRLP